MTQIRLLSPSFTNVEYFDFNINKDSVRQTHPLKIREEIITVNNKY